jgi:hypothetical protein
VLGLAFSSLLERNESKGFGHLFGEPMGMS